MRWGDYLHMNLLEFNQLQNLAKGFLHHSFQYLDYDQVKEHEIVRNDKNIIFISGVNEDNREPRSYWATNEVSELLDAINQYGKKTIISFIPLEWSDYLINHGLSEYAKFRAYWIHDINGIKGVNLYEFLTLEECREASDVTMACKSQSRGFYGETMESIKEWMTSIDSAGEDSGNYNVLVHKEDNLIVGIAMVATYGHNSEKGSVLWLREIAVMPNYQGKGIGKRLMLQAIQYGQDKGARRSFLMADDCNNNAIDLYKKVGYLPSDDVEINLISNIE